MSSLRLLPVRLLTLTLGIAVGVLIFAALISQDRVGQGAPALQAPALHAQASTIVVPTSQAPASEPDLTPLATYTQNDVTVQIALKALPNGQRALLATFTPLRPHYHLYSKDLPRLGLHGVGRPTLMEITPTSGLTLLGNLEANQPTFDHFSHALEQALPVYPSGPVLLTQRLSLSPQALSAPIQLTLTYMACSEDTCLSPVDSQPLTLYPNKSS
jgi:Disulphide bond corrector protein DsbC